MKTATSCELASETSIFDSNTLELTEDSDESQNFHEIEKLDGFQLTSSLSSNLPDLSEETPLQRYSRIAEQYTVLEADTEKELFKQYQNSELSETQKFQIRDFLILSNLRLVLKVVRKYRNLRYPIEELIGHGVLGLITAIEKFDLTFETKFSTYAIWWIRQSIGREFQLHSNLIKLPVWAAQARLRVYTFTEKFQHEHGRLPTTTELTEALELSAQAIEDIQLYEYVVNTLSSLNISPRNFNNNETSEIIQMIPDLSAQSSEEILLEAEVQQTVKQLLAELKPRHREVLERRLGLHTSPETLEGIGNSLGLTHERIRQIERLALKQLRQKALRKKLREPNEFSSATFSTSISKTR